MVASSSSSGRGATLRGLIVGDDPGAWRDAGFTVTATRLLIGDVSVHLPGADGERSVRGWWFDPSSSGPADVAAATSTPTTVDGLPVLPPPPDGEPGAATPPPHPNGVEALDHVVVASPDVDRTTAAFASIGVHPRRTLEGVRGDVDVRYRFFLAGTCVIEVVGPTRPDLDSADQPARFAGLAFTAPRVDGFGELASSPRAAVQPGRTIVTLRAPGISVPVAVLTPRGRRDRPGAPSP